MHATPHELFHVHTCYTDGQLSVGDYFEFAKVSGVSRIGFLEHIRRAPSYSVEEFVTEVRTGARVHGVPAECGFEAKLLADGMLDIIDDHVECAGVLGIAEHGFPDDAALLERSFCTAVARYRRAYPGLRLVWVHPGLWFRKRDPSWVGEARYWRMMECAIDHCVEVELNARYRLAPGCVLDTVDQRHLVVGADAHCLGDLINWQQFSSGFPGVGA